MPLPILGPILAGAAGVIGNAINSGGQSAVNEQNIQFQREMYERQRKDAIEFFNMSNAYNSPQEQMKRFELAGLNPALMYSRGDSGAAGSIPVPDTAPPQLRNPEWGNMLSGGANALEQMYNLDIKQAQVDNMEAQNTVLQQEAMIKDVERRRKEFDFSLEQDLREVSADYRRESLRQLTTNIDLATNKDAREAVMTSSNVEEAAERIKQMYEQRAIMAMDRWKTSEEIGRIEQEKKRIVENINLLKQQGVLNQLEINLRKKGVNPNDPTWARILVQAFQRAVDAPAGTFSKSSWGDWFKMIFGF
nr:MAG: DNA pilot protein [Microvirus sp.]